MKLEELFKSLPIELPHELREMEVGGVKTNSKEVNPGDLFVAVKGTKTDGHLFLEEAFSKGALVAVCDQGYPVHSKKIIKVPDTSKILPYLASNFFGNPASQMTLIGITGTNGKTTSSYLIESILRTQGYNVGVIGTLGYRTKNRQKTLNLTTPDPIGLMSIFSEMRKENVRYVVMEVSSHSLAQHRIDCCRYSIAVFTNLSRDHLDYHKDMEDYFHQKQRLFTELLKENGTARSVINKDDLYAKRLIAQIKPTITYGLDSSCDIYPVKQELSSKGIKAEVETPVGSLKINSELMGLHNLYNIMAAIGATIPLEIEKEAIESGIKDLKLVPGRLQAVPNNLGIGIFVDYAHTPDALQTVLTNLRAITKGRLTVVFGCGGDRDKGKRPLMGQIAISLADKVVITSDNPRSEDPMSIISDIEAGIKGSSTPYLIEPDRKRAIELSIREAKQGDTVLIAGKGHEDYQIIGDQRLPFSDLEVSKDIVLKLERSI